VSLHYLVKCQVS